MLLPSVAAAGDKYRFRPVIRPVGDTGAPSGSLDVGRLDTAKSSTVRVVRGATTIYTVTNGSGPSTASLTAGTLTSGDKIEVEQPTGTFQESFTIPDVSISGTAGSPTITGRAPDGMPNSIRYSPSCYAPGAKLFSVPTSAGGFSLTYPTPVRAGQDLDLHVFPGKGDEVEVETLVPGETPCINTRIYEYSVQIGATPNPTPFGLVIDGLLPSGGTGARVVLRRAGTALVDYSEPSATYSASTSTAVQPQAGDVIEVYRPHTAPTPEATFTIPAVTGTYDTSNSLLAIDAPASALLRSFVGQTYGPYQNVRTTANTANGRTIQSYAAPQMLGPAVSLSLIDYVSVRWVSTDGLGQYELMAKPGDLAAPALKLKLASKFKLSKLGSSFPLSVTSSEAASAKFALTLPAKLKGAKAGKTKRPVTIASAKLSIKAGTTKVKLKLTKAGKELLKKIRSERLPAQTATLTATASDASGNSGATTKLTKLVRK